MALVHWTRSAVVAAVVAAASSLAGCGGDGTTSSRAGDEGRSSRPADEGAFPRTVAHAMGETTVREAPDRVVALDATFVDAVLTLETPLVGYTTIAGITGGLPDYLGAAATTYGAAAKPVGALTTPSLEQIAALQPDLILSAKVRHEEFYDQLSAMAPTVFSDTTGASWKENIRLAGRALGQEQLAEAKIADFEERAEQVGDAIRAKVGGNPTISVVLFVDGPTRLYKEDTYVGVVLQDMGLARPASQQGTGFAAEISEERLLDMDADHIFVTNYPDEEGLSVQTRQKFEANPLWRQLRGKVHNVDDLTWMSAVGMHGAHIIVDDLAATFGVDPAK